MLAVRAIRCCPVCCVVWLMLVCGVLLPAVPAVAGEQIGVVLMHGEQGAPSRVIGGLGQALVAAGYLVGRPDMCWSARRAYEAEFPDCLSAVDNAIVKLRNLGATSIVVAGFSLGGTAAVVYCADHPGCLGVIAIAPGHDAPVVAADPEIAQSIKHAQELLAAGKGDNTDTFADVSVGPTGPYTSEIATTARIYLSFVGADSRASIHKALAHLTAPLLWIVGADEAKAGGDASAITGQAPANPRSRYVAVMAGPLGTPEASKAAVLAWLRDLGGG